MGYDANELLEKYRLGICTADEKRLVERYLNKRVQDSDLLPNEHRMQASIARLEAALRRRNKTPRRLRMGKWLPYAAAIVAAILVGVWVFDDGRSLSQAPSAATLSSGDIPPGKNRAKLTLGDGQTFHLSEDKAGIKVSNGAITYNDGELLGQSTLGGAERVEYATLSTPNGGTYQVVLPDGTKVWLNAGTTLKYPIRFDDKARIVDIDGEAYFDVSTNKNWPFKVNSHNHAIEVVGTRFNISAYHEDLETRTTLLEGGVRIINQITNTTDHLNPGEQSIVRDGTTEIKQVEAARYVAWKDGYFNFKNTPLKEVLRQVSRWYDVEVNYMNGIPNERFGGEIKRDISLLGLIEVLRMSDVKISLEGNTLLVN